MSKVLLLTVVGRDGPDILEPVTWYPTPVTQAVVVARAAPVMDWPPVERKGAKSWVLATNGDLRIFVAENFEAICKALDAQAVHG